MRECMRNRSHIRFLDLRSRPCSSY